MVKQYEMELVFNFFLTFIIGDNKDVVNKKKHSDYNRNAFK
jgi:hypothetical protein